MKRLLGTVLALALMTPPGASAELLKNLKVSGQLDVQMTSARNVTDFATRPENQAGGGDNNDRIGTTLTRTMLNLDWDLLDDVHAQASMVKNDRVWGQSTVAGGSQQGAAPPTAQGLIGAPGSSDVAGNVLLQQANIKIDKLFGHVDTTVGRQYYGTPGDLVIYFGPKDSHGMFVTSIDAVRAEAENDMMAFSGLAGTAAAPAGAVGLTIAGNTGNANTQVRGFDVMWKNLPVRAHTFVWNRVIQGAGGLGVVPTNAVAATGLNDYLYVYGVKLRGEAMGGWFNLDLAKNSGQDRTTLAGAGGGFSAASGNYIGTALLLDLGYNAEIANVGGLTPWANFGWGSGRSNNGEESNENFTAIAPDYRPGVINRRFNASGAVNLGANSSAGGTGTLGLTNRVVWGVGLNFTPAAWDRLTAGVSVWDYRFQRNTITGIGTTALAAGNKHIGSEFGLTGEWRHSENVTLGAGWASFQPGGLHYEAKKAAVPGLQEGVNPAQMVFADLTVRF